MTLHTVFAVPSFSIRFHNALLRKSTSSSPTHRWELKKGIVTSVQSPQDKKKEIKWEIFLNVHK